MKNSKLLPLLAVIAGNIFWGLSFLFISEALKYAPSNVMLAHRFLISTLILAVFLLIRGKKLQLKGKPWGPMFLLMIAQTAYYIFETTGLQHSNTTISGLVLAVVPIVAIVTGAVFLKEIPTMRQVLLCLLPVAGVILMTVYGNELGVLQPLGILLLLGACVSSALYKTANRKCSADFDSWERTFYILLSSTVFFSITGLDSVNYDAAAFFAPLMNLHYLTAILFLGIFCSIIANVLVNYAAGHMEVLKLSSFGALSTLCAMVTGVLILHEPMNLGLGIGAVLIITGIYFLTAK